MTIKYVSETEAQVTKAFAKKAVIFGTEEYKLWREYRKDFPQAQMITKTIKKNPDKETNKNLTYKNMEAYIMTQDNAEDLMKEFHKAQEMAKVQTSPYRCVLAWFKQTFPKYDEYKVFFNKKSETTQNDED